MDRAKLIRKGPLFYRIIRKCAEGRVAHIEKVYNDDYVLVRIKFDGPKFYFVADEFEETYKVIKNELNKWKTQGS